MDYLEREGASLHFRVSGTPGKPWLVFSNSLAADLGMWDEQMVPLNSQFRILRYDNRGHGRSSATSGPYSMQMLAEDVLAILDHLGVDRAQWCGLSLGGMVGQWLLCNRPERIGRAVLANTAACWPNPAIWDERIALVRDQGIEAIIPATLERWFTKRFHGSHPERVATIAAGMRKTSAEGYTGACAAIRDIDFVQQLRAVSHPLILIAGEHDPSTPASLMEIMRKDNGATLLRLDCAHISNIEASHMFTSITQEFLL